MREGCTVCQSPEERQFNLGNMQACNGVTEPVDVQPRLLPIQLNPIDGFVAKHFHCHFSEARGFFSAGVTSA